MEATSGAEPATTSTPVPVTSYQAESTPSTSATTSMVQANRHVLPMAVIALALIGAMTAMVLLNKTIPTVFEDAMIGVSFAIAGLTQPPRV